MMHNFEFFYMCTIKLHVCTYLHLLYFLYDKNISKNSIIKFYYFIFIDSVQILTILSIHNILMHIVLFVIPYTSREFMMH